jgi:hypothetical protein
MRRPSIGILVSIALVAMCGMVLAHHSAAMFDQQDQIEIEGVVQEFKFTSPHSFIVLKVKGQDGSITVWNLEGQTPAALTRDGWSKKSLSPGDELKLKIAPLRSGAPGGWWTTQDTKHRDGKEIETSP